MAMSLSPVLRKLVYYHWRRNSPNQGPILAYSYRAQALQQCVANHSSQLSSLQGFEQSILPVIAAFAGLAAAQPCTCCKEEPFRFCLKQGMHFQVKSITCEPLSKYPNKDEKESDTDRAYSSAAMCYEIFLPLPLGLYQMLEKDDFLYYARRQFFVHTLIKDWDWTEYTQKNLGGIKPIRVMGGGIKKLGPGYLVCTSERLYSDMMDITWKSMRDYHMTLYKSGGKKYVMALRTPRKFSQNYARKVYYEDFYGAGRLTTIVGDPLYSLMAYDFSEKTIEFQFRSKKKLKKLKRLIYTQLKKTSQISIL